MTLAEAEPRKGDRPPVDPASILGAIPDPVLVLGPRDEILYCNQGAEQFFAASAALLHGQGLADPAGAGALKALLRGVGVAVYSLLLAIPVGWLLVRTIPWWGFQATAHRTPTMR